MLLEELYYRTLDVIEGEGIDGQDLSDWVEQIKAVVWELVPAEHRGGRLEEFLARANPRYCLDFYPGVIADHFMEIESRLSETHKDTLPLDDLIVRKIDHRKPGYSSITLIIQRSARPFLQNCRHAFFKQDKYPDFMDPSDRSDGNFHITRQRYTGRAC